MNFLIKGIILGFAIAAPVGPIGIMCIRRTLQYGRWSGFCTGLGAAAADTVYGIIAYFGVDLLAHVNQFWFRFIGGTILLFLGNKIFFTIPQERIKSVSNGSLFKDFLSTFFLTLTNPLTLIAYLAIFAAIGVNTGVTFQAEWLILGVFLGSSFWWVLLSEGITLFRKKITQDTMVLVNRIAGFAIFVFGVGAIIYAFQ